MNAFVSPAALTTHICKYVFLHAGFSDSAQRVPASKEIGKIISCSPASLGYENGVVPLLNHAGYMVTMRTTYTPYFEYTFAMVRHYGEDVYITLNFDDAFNTPYLEFMDIPQVFVGTKDELLRVIYLATNAMARRYAEDHLFIPPWRSLTSIMEKWFGKKYTDRVST